MASKRTDAAASVWPRGQLSKVRRRRHGSSITTAPGTATPSFTSRGAALAADQTPRLAARAVRGARSPRKAPHAEVAQAREHHSERAKQMCRTWRRGGIGGVGAKVETHVRQAVLKQMRQLRALPVEDEQWHGARKWPCSVNSCNRGRYHA